MVLPMLSAASAVMDFFAQSQQAKAQNEYAMMNAQSANDAAILKYGQEIARQREEEANKTRQRNQLMLDAMNARGTALASSQNEGNSLNMTLQDLTRQELRQINTIDADSKIDRQQGVDNLYGIQKEAESRIAGVQTTSGPSLLNLAISGLGGFAQAGGFDKKKKPTKPRGYGTKTNTSPNSNKGYMFSDAGLNF